MPRLYSLDDYIRVHCDETILYDSFINRELSWIEFNKRVLFLANKKDIPLNERLNFLSITDSNLDEFISVRFSSLLSEGEKMAKVTEEVLQEVKRFIAIQGDTYTELNRILKEKGRHITTVAKLGKADLATSTDIFMKRVFPLLTPISIGSTNELPNILSGQNCIVATIKQNDVEIFNIIPLNDGLEKMFFIKDKIIMVEDIVMSNLNKLFVNKEIISKGSFRIIKDANIPLNHDESTFIIDRMTETLMMRKFSTPIFMQIEENTPKRIRRILTTLFDLPQEMVARSKMLDYTRFSEKILSESNSYEKFEPAQYSTVEDYYSIFSAINKQDILLQHPYESFDTVIKFVEHAATDPSVVAIKQTLYRVSSTDSPIVDALVKAAENGKEVSVLIEIKARFDEDRNIAVIEKLKNAGVHILLGIEYLKTHCKFCIIVRKEKDDIKIYSHISTGNYNDKTSRVYTDLSFFTAKQKIGEDLLNVFNILSGASSPDDKLQRVFYAPINLREKLEKLIDREIDFAEKGKKAEIFLKLNSLSDEKMVNKLYHAAKKGVRIYIICRGVCSIVPRENIFIKSIIGRFLEHSRIFYFRNGKDPEYFISSADFLTRNLDRRVEIMLSLKDSSVIAKLHSIISVMKEDTTNAFQMKEDGKYKYLNGSFNSHEWFIHSASSGLKMTLPKKAKKKK